MVQVSHHATLGASLGFTLNPNLCYTQRDLFQADKTSGQGADTKWHRLFLLRQLSRVVIRKT